MSFEPSVHKFPVFEHSNNMCLLSFLPKHKGLFSLPVYFLIPFNFNTQTCCSSAIPLPSFLV